MFNWLGNLFPYSDLHSLNLDWILSKMKETAAQAAKAIADSANALAQVIEANTAAQNAQTAAQDAQTAANKAAGNAASAAANAVQALNAAQTAQTTAQNAQTAAQTAQSTAENAQSAAQTAQTTAQNAQTAAQTAQSTAENAQSAAQTAQETADNIANKFPVKTADIADNAVTMNKINSNAVGPAQIADTAKFKAKWNSATNFANVVQTATRYAISVDNTMYNKFGEVQVNPADSKYIAIFNRVMFLNIAQINRIVDLTLFNTETGEKTHYWLAYEYDNGYYIVVYKDGDLTTVENLPVTLNIRVDAYKVIIDK